MYIFFIKPTLICFGFVPDMIFLQLFTTHESFSHVVMKMPLMACNTKYENNWSENFDDTVYGNPALMTFDETLMTFW